MKPTPAQLKALTAGMMWGPLRVDIEKKLVYRRGSDEPVCNMRTMAVMVEREWFKVTGKRAVTITGDGRKVERAAHGDTGRVVTALTKRRQRRAPPRA